MSIFFTADSHFCFNDEEGTIKRDFRPFSSCEEMNEEIIKIWNSQADENDTIYHLGDFINFNRLDYDNFEKSFLYIKKIKAKVILFLGNNEERLVREKFDNDFEKFKTYLIKLGFKDVLQGGLDLTLHKKEISETGEEIVKELPVYLNHYPIKHKEGVLNLFGHIHSTVKVKTYGFNVGVDVFHFRLCPEDYIFYLNDCQVKFDENVYN